MRPRFCLLLPIIGMMSACGPEQAASQSAPAQPSTSCKNVDFAEALALCTTLIQSGKVSGLLLAAAFNDRGDAYIKNSDFDHAIEDYDHAIELVPEYALAFGGRALAYAGKFEYERAIEDYNQAVFLDRNFALAFYLRGMAKLALCDIEGGEIDINTARALDPNVGY